MLGVLLGAFATHALKSVLRPEDLDIFKTGVNYQLIHSLAITSTGICSSIFGRQRRWTWAVWLFIVGIAIFSGSLYALATTGVKAFGAITPIGGVCFLLGWITLAVEAASHREYPR